MLLQINDQERTATQSLSIAAVERETGLSKDTLRVWERRYGFPHPGRDTAGNRVYPPEQVERLRFIRRLMDAGHRPRRIVALTLQALQALQGAQAAPVARPMAATTPDGLFRIDFYLGLISRHDVRNLRRELAQSVLRLGLVRFITEVVAPLNMAVGDAWMQGRLQVFEERLYTECITGMLRNTIGHIQLSQGSSAPRVLLTTFPNEPHGLGLLMVEALLALEGCHCLPLGPQTPIADMVRASSSYDADIVVLSFSALLNAKTVVTGLKELRHQLPRRIALWVGGQCPVLYQQKVPGVLPMQDLEGLREQVACWRLQASGMPASADTA